MVASVVGRAAGVIVPVGYRPYPKRGIWGAGVGDTVEGTVARRIVLLLDTSVPLIVAAAIVVVSLVQGGTGAPGLGLGLAAALMLALRRRAPGWTFAISGGLVIVVLHLNTRIGPIAVLAPAVALYSLALTRGRTEQLLAAVAAVVAVVAADVVDGGHASIVQSLGHLTLVAIPLLAAETLRTRRSNVSLVLERLELAEQTRERETQRRVEQERMRIARDLHDVVAHTLTIINVQAATAAQLLDRDPSHARAALDIIEEASRDAIAELRAILGVLRDRDQPDAPTTPVPGVDDVAGLVERARDAGFDISLTVTGTPPQRLPEAASLAAYRIVQESLTNARRHATGGSVRVTMSFEPRQVAVSVENDAGTAAPAGNGIAPKGVGITGMTERAEAAGGTLRAVASANGFRVDAELPYALGVP
ncbi:MAG: histidine kinase [Actinomycetota bacterium]|nr:histidine kinase [Actinomycetota bacterium]MDQ6944985.1 histidine kinase [Actinomycetota bacterium]